MRGKAYYGKNKVNDYKQYTDYGQREIYRAGPEVLADHEVVIHDKAADEERCIIGKQQELGDKIECFLVFKKAEERYKAEREAHTAKEHSAERDQFADLEYGVF